MAALPDFRRFLSGAGTAIVSDPLSRPAYGGFLRVLCADVLQSHAGIPAAWNLITTPPGQLSAALSKIHIPTPVILGLLVVFRFFPTMKAELKGVRQSMKNRRLTGPAQVLRHPAVTCEYVLVPMLLRCLQTADQLSVSAIARGAQARGMGSYYARKMHAADSSGWGYGRLEPSCFHNRRDKVIRFEHVNFQYAGSETGVTDICLHVRKGECVVLTGFGEWKNHLNPSGKRSCSRFLYRPVFRLYSD